MPGVRKNKAASAAKAGPRGGKGYFLNARITAELRRAIEKEADDTGRSMSQVVEQWLEEARRSWTREVRQLESSAVLLAMARSAQDIEARFGPPSRSEAARYALVGAFQRHLKALPKPAPLSEAVDYARAERSVAEAERVLRGRHLSSETLEGDLWQAYREAFAGKAEGWERLDSWLRDIGVTPNAASLMARLALYGDGDGAIPIPENRALVTRAVLLNLPNDAPVTRRSGDEPWGGEPYDSWPLTAAEREWIDYYLTQSARRDQLERQFSVAQEAARAEGHAYVRAMDHRDKMEEAATQHAVAVDEWDTFYGFADTLDPENPPDPIEPL